MAISPVSDIVKDVVDAAEPQAVAAARARLAQSAVPASAESFETVAANLDVKPAADAVARPAQELDPTQKFEAMVLGTFMETLLPDDTESAYGGGMAGGMWKSLLAQKLGTELAQRGGIGIADRLLKDHYTADGKTVPVGERSATSDQAKAGEAMLSASLVSELQRKAMSTLQAPAPQPASGR
ncbi:rod-binding protein [Mesorhizobium sp. RP14(2022)]|uniref:Rod-binding protein n=1 Tax=Mesorhizobium liriopis TaxID=2953882 RepID=A0ABT1C8A9_9HYPH|nr:rod-binding protein [Mesorhizobium liriopis]